MAAAPAAGAAARGRGATSFQRKAAAGSRLAAVPGTRPSVRHGQLLLSSGLPSLDCVLGWWGAGPGTRLLPPPLPARQLPPSPGPACPLPSVTLQRLPKAFPSAPQLPGLGGGWGKEEGGKQVPFPARVPCPACGGGGGAGSAAGVRRGGSPLALRFGRFSSPLEREAALRVALATPSWHGPNGHPEGFHSLF